MRLSVEFALLEIKVKATAVELGDNNHQFGFRLRAEEAFNEDDFEVVEICEIQANRLTHAKEKVNTLLKKRQDSEEMLNPLFIKNWKPTTSFVERRYMAFDLENTVCVYRIRLIPEDGVTMQDLYSHEELLRADRNRRGRISRQGGEIQPGRIPGDEDESDDSFEKLMTDMNLLLGDE